MGDTANRNWPGWGAAGTYTDFTGRNDFVLARVARDDTYVYFSIQTAANISSYTGSNWMLLFINADQDYRTGWQGYDYVVDLGGNSATSTTLKGTSGGWNWTNVSVGLPYQVTSNKLELRQCRLLLLSLARGLLFWTTFGSTQGSGCTGRSGSSGFCSTQYSSWHRSM